MNHTAGLTVTCPGMASLVLSLHAESWSPWVVPLASLHSAHVCHGTLNMTAWPCSASLVWQQGHAQLKPFSVSGRYRQLVYSMYHPPQGSVTCRLTGLPGALAWLVHLEPSLYSFWFSISLPLFALCLCSAAALFGHFRLAILPLHSSATPSE